MQYRVQYNTNGHQVHLDGPFTFTDREKFKEIIVLTHVPGSLQIILNLSGVSYVDSAALGMLLLLRDVCQEKGMKLSLEEANGEVARIFALSRFEELFDYKP